MEVKQSLKRENKLALHWAELRMFRQMDVWCAIKG